MDQPVPAGPPRAAHRLAAARAPRTTPGTGVHLRPRLGPPANSQPLARLCAYRTRAVRRRWAVVKDVGVRPPNDGQAAARG